MVERTLAVYDETPAGQKAERRRCREPASSSSRSVVDALAYNVAVLAAFELRFAFHVPAFNVDPFLRIAPGLTVAFLLCAYVYGLYDPERIEGFWQVVRGAATASTLALLLTLGILQLAGRAFDAFPRLVILIAWPLQMLLLVGWRALSTRITPIRWPEQRVLIVGTGPLAVELAGELSRRAKWGYRVVGLIARDEDAVAGAPPRGRSAATSPTCARIVREQRDRPRDRRLAGRAARARRGHHALGRRGRARRRRARALRDLHRRGRQHRRRHPAHGDHPPLAAVVRRSQARDRRARRAAAARWSCSARSSCSPSLAILRHDGRAGVLRPGAAGQGHEAVPRPQVPHDGARRRGEQRPGPGRGRGPAHHAGRPVPAPLPASTSCRSSSTSCAAR